MIIGGLRKLEKKCYDVMGHGHKRYLKVVHDKEEVEKHWTRVLKELLKKWEQLCLLNICQI